MIAKLGKSYSNCGVETGLAKGEDMNVEAKRLRHRWEMPMVWISVIISLLGLLVAIGGEAGLFAAMTADMTAEDLADFESVTSSGWLLLVAPLGIFIYRFYVAAGARANSVKVGPRQFPELWAMYERLAGMIGVPGPPGFYVSNGNGVVNAYALSCNTRSKYVVIHAEIAHLIHSHPKIVEFVLAHELSHHKLGHVSLWRIVINLIPGLLFLPGKAMTRAQEYSADRLAFHHCPDTIEGCSFLGVGPFMAGQVDSVSMMEQAVEDDRSLWIRLHNVMSDHAVLTKRFKALKDMETKGIGSHGQMF